MQSIFWEHQRSPKYGERVSGESLSVPSHHLEKQRFSCTLSHTGFFLEMEGLEQEQPLITQRAGVESGQQG